MNFLRKNFGKKETHAQHVEREKEERIISLFFKRGYL